MGRVLAGADVVGRVATRSVLGRASAGEPQGDALGSGTVRAGRLSPAGAGQRVAAASGMVRTDRAGRSAGRRLRAGRDPQALSLPRPAAGAQTSAVRSSDGPWRDLFNNRFDLLLYDLTSTYFEAEPPFPDGDKRRFGYSRDHRPDCLQVVVALVVTPEGLPLAYEILPGNTSDKTTLRDFLERIERQYGKARRVWLMDRGVPTEEVLAE